MSRIKNSTVRICKKIYRALPMQIETKQKIKNKLSNHFSIVQRMSRYHDQLRIHQIFSSHDILLDSIEPLEKLNQKIAVHLHLYYTDLSDEFIYYLNNMPYKFDLFLSIQEGEKKEWIQKKFEKIKHVEKIVIKETKNVGRDFSPMFVLFKNEFLQYDYLLHMHTKKSVRTGKQQDGWRQHMMKGVLGDSILIKKIFGEFVANEKVGLIYPETYYDMPYWAHTWLQNKANCDAIAQKLNICLKDEYIDYSVGSFFWVKVKSIQKFLNFNYTWEDFGKEEGAADGTLAHAIERMIPQVVMAAGDQYLVYDAQNKVLRHNGLKNLSQYESQTKEQCLDTLLQYDIISFDIFDTLITRKVIEPSIIFDLLADFVEQNYHIVNFKQKRQAAEYNVRVEKNFINDCDINEIYDHLLKTLEIGKQELDLIKEYEIELELKYCIPRKDLLEIYNTLREKGKTIILISDMYLTSDIIEKMLHKCGYDGWEKLLVSSETGLRKDNGGIWNAYFQEIVGERTAIHVGDNEQSDVQKLCDMGKPFYHVMHPYKMNKLTPYYAYMASQDIEYTNADQVALGLMINQQLYNSPFRKLNQPTISTFYDFGYVMFGPIMLKFFTFLQKHIENKEYKQLLFLAREGHYLQKIYKDFCRASKKSEIPNMYFLTSRRSVSVACIQNVADAKELLSSGFEGRMDHLFKNRFGIIDQSIPSKSIKLEEDKKEVFHILETNFKQYLESFQEESKSYKEYCEKHFSQEDQIAVVDLGYSGTIQYYLMKLNHMKMDGYYFTLSDHVKPLNIGGNCYGCFDSQKEPTEKNIFLFSMILEAFLTAPYNQLVRFDQNGEPIYKEGIIDENMIGYLDQIYEGVKSFIEDLIELTEDSCELSNSFVSANFSSLVYVDSVLEDKIKSVFQLENSYSLDATINVFDYLNLVYTKQNEK